MQHPLRAIAAATALFAFAVFAFAVFALPGAAAAQPASGGVRAACQADIQKLCPDARPGPGGGMRECVKGHWSDLSDACKAAIAKMRAEHQPQRGAGAGQ